MNEEKISSSDPNPSEPYSDTPELPGSGLQQMAKETAETAKAKIETLKSAAQEQGAAAVEEMKTVAQTAAREAQEAGRDFIHEQKENLAHKVDKYAEAVRATSERLRSDEGNVLADPAQKAAEQLERISSYLRDREPGDFLYDLESYARRRPEIVFGGLFVVGLAIARFLKASRSRPRHAGSPEPIGNAGSSQLLGAAPSSGTGSEFLSEPSAFPSTPSSSPTGLTSPSHE